MKKVIISQPMNEKDKDEIIETRKRAIEYLKSKDYEIVNNLFTEQWNKPENLEENKIINPSLYFLGKSIEAMSKCDSVYFAKGWALAKGCRVERLAAILYKLEILEEK